MTPSHVYNPRRRRHPLAMPVDGHGTPLRQGPVMTEAIWRNKVAVMARVADRLAALDRPLTRREERSARRAAQVAEWARVARRSRT